MQDKDLLNRLYWIDGKSLREIGLIYGVREARVYKWMKRLGVKTRPWTTKGLKFPGRTVSEEVREKLRKWRMGRKLSPYLAKLATKNLEKIREKYRKPIGTIKKWHRLYLAIKVAPNKWKYYHRYLVEQKIGRELKREEQVHHINFDSGDNNIDNLLVISHKDHLKLHSQIEYVMKDLIKNGLVYFDGKLYKINHS